MYRIIIFRVVVLIVLTTLPLYAQKKPMKWGKIPIEDLQMQVYPADSNASAVILCDYGSVYFTPKLNMIFEHHRRVKILTEEGYSYSEVTIPFYAESNLQTVKDIKGETSFLTEDGKIKKNKLEGKSIYEEKGKYWHFKKFALPAVKPGTVIEYKYKVVTVDPWHMPDWQFQNGEPTRWSEYRIERPEFLRYVPLSQGSDVYFVRETEPYSMEFTWKTRRGSGIENPYALRSRDQYYSQMFRGVKYRWVRKDVSALRREPYMTTPKDYRAKIQFQLAEIVFEGQAPINYVDATPTLSFLNHS